MLVWRVVGWDARFETRRSLRKRGPRGEIAVSTDLEVDNTRRLLEAPGGFIAFAVWNLICRLAATCERRGVLAQNGQPMSDADLSRLARVPLNLIQPALKVLACQEIGLLERVPLDQALLPAQTLAPLPRKPRIQPLLQCPVCSADLTEYYQLETPTKKEVATGGQGSKPAFSDETGPSSDKPVTSQSSLASVNRGEGSGVRGNRTSPSPLSPSPVQEPRSTGAKGATSLDKLASAPEAAQSSGLLDANGSAGNSLSYVDLNANLNSNHSDQCTGAEASSHDDSSHADLPVIPLAAVREPIADVSPPTQKVPELSPRSEIIREFAITSPHPSWNKLPWIRKSTEREFEEMHVRYFLHEITRAELDHFLDTHYYDEDDPDNDDWEDEDNELQTDIPPPK